MTVRVWDYLAEYAQEREDILDAVDTVFSSGQLVLGPSVAAFEEEFAQYHGLAHCVGVDNGTNAIKLGLEALGVQRGDEVITVSNTAAPTVVAIEGAGAVARFVDVRLDDQLMDVGQLEAAVTERTSAIVPVHLYGQCVDMDAVNEVAARHGLAVLEDCAQAHGARRDGRLAGTMGDAAAFSFYPTKILGAYGDGGAVVSASAQVDRALRRLRYYGMEEAYYVVGMPGHNSRLDAVQAEILRRKLGRLDAYIKARRQIADRYAEALGDTDLVLPQVTDGNEHTYYLYVARHPARDDVLAALEKEDIALTVSYRWPVHTMSGFAHLRTPAGSLPVTERLAGEIFSLPMYAGLDRELQDTVIAAVRRAIGAG